jgi:hypothetical protein
MQNMQYNMRNMQYNVKQHAKYAIKFVKPFAICRIVTNPDFLYSVYAGITLHDTHALPNMLMFSLSAAAAGHWQAPSSVHPGHAGCTGTGSGCGPGHHDANGPQYYPQQSPRNE